MVRFSSSSRSSSSRADLESRAPVGSSASTRAGRVTMARAAAHRCCWPPDICQGYLSRQSAMPSSSAISRTRPGISRAGALTMDRDRAMFSKAVRVSSRLQSWKMNPSRSRRNRASSRPRRPVSSRPSMTMEPDVGRSMVAIQLSRVVLPEPEGPITPTNSPCSRDRDTPSRARVAAAPLP